MCLLRHRSRRSHKGSTAHGLPHSERIVATSLHIRNRLGPIAGGLCIRSQNNAGQATSAPALSAYQATPDSLIRRKCADNSTGHARNRNDRNGEVSPDDRQGPANHCILTNPVEPVGHDVSLPVGFDRQGRRPQTHCDPHGRADPHGCPVLSVLARLASTGDRREYLARTVSTPAQGPLVR